MSGISHIEERNMECLLGFGGTTLDVLAVEKKVRCIVEGRIWNLCRED